MKRLLPLYLFLITLVGCSYHFDGGERIAVSVPYVSGDFEGELTDALVWAISRTPQLRYTHGEGDWTLKAKILGEDNERIGYRYDRDKVSGERRDNLVGIENRKTITVEVTLVSNATGCPIIGPQVVKADTAYDYFDHNSLQDLSFINFDGERDTSIAFSLGQLDSVGAAGEDAIYPLYRLLAQKIVEGILGTGGPNDG